MKWAVAFAGAFWTLGAINATNNLLLSIGLHESAAALASVAGILVSVGIIVGQVRRICRWVEFEMDKRLDEFAESVDERIERIEARERRVTDH